MTLIHELKTLPYYFALVKSGQKTFEIRHNDRQFNQGDYVRLREYDPLFRGYSGRNLLFKIGFVDDNTGFEEMLGTSLLKKDYVVFSLIPTESVTCEKCKRLFPPEYVIIGSWVCYECKKT